MSLSSHLNSLVKKHQTISKELEKAYVKHCSDIELNRLKKMKLRLKDEITLFNAISNDNSETLH